MPKCDNCFKREGRLVMSENFKAQPYIGIYKSWQWDYYLCSWCKGVWNKRANRLNQKWIKYIDE